MTEILWHGRGGQGAFTAAKLLGASYSQGEGKSALAFPSFGPERRGAPILAFTKLDTKEIGDRSQIKKADYVIYLDDTLFSPAAFNEIKEGGKILVNTKKSAEELAKAFVEHGENIAPATIIPFDADSLALEVLKMPVSNTAMLSLLACESKIVSEEELLQAVQLYMPSKIAAKNVELVKRVYDAALAGTVGAESFQKGESTSISGGSK